MVTDDAIVLRLVDWSETSYIAGLLTREHGKVSATAKGAKRQTPSVQAKFSGGLEVATSGQAVLIIREGRDLANLTEWHLHDAHWRLRRDLRAYELAMYAIDLTHHMLHDHDPHPRSFEALRDALSVLGDDSIGGDDAPALLRFQWALIDDAGYRPMLDTPSAAQTLHFSAQAGGLVDGPTAESWKVRRSTIDLLRQMNGDAPCPSSSKGEGRGEGETATIRTAPGSPRSSQPSAPEGRGGKPGVEPINIDRANRLLCAYCRAILDRQLPTMRAILESRS
jgi:DNA repair protein RecO (recombination protein O)